MATAMPDHIEVMVTWVPVISAKQGERVLALEDGLEVRPPTVTMRIAPISGQKAVERTATYTAEDIGAWMAQNYAGDLIEAIVAAKRAALRG